jgi:periplasmic protein TonB
MFDKLVESTKTKPSYRGGRIFLLTGLMYATLLTTLGVWTILGLNPGLADSLDVSLLTPPVPLGPTLPTPQKTLAMSTKPAPVVSTFTPPPRPIEIADPETIQRFSNVRVGPFVHGAPPCSDCGSGTPTGLLIGKLGDTPPPPPEPKPTPEPTPEVKPTVPSLIKVSGGVAEGKAIRKITPQYSAIARAARVAGPVQIQVTISEEGRVIEATVLNGHPLLRQAALDAARQWLFRPTLLSEMPVKVQGVLTFNFTLN